MGNGLMSKGELLICRTLIYSTVYNKLFRKRIFLWNSIINLWKFGQIFQKLYVFIHSLSSYQFQKARTGVKKVLKLLEIIKNWLNVRGTIAVPLCRKGLIWIRKLDLFNISILICKLNFFFGSHIVFQMFQRSMTNWSGFKDFFNFLLIMCKPTLFLISHFKNWK